MFYINLLKPSPSTFGATMSKLGGGDPATNSGMGSGRWPMKAVLEHITGKARRRESLLGACSLVRLPFVSDYATTLSIFASDKSAFCEIQLSLWYAFDTKRESGCPPLLTEGKALAHVNTVLGWASLSRDTVTSGVRWTLLPTENDNAAP